MNNYSTTSPRMRFGRYKGHRLCEIPADYLAWLLRTPGIRPELKLDVQLELQERAERASGARPMGHSATAKLPAGVTIADVLAVVEHGRRALSQKVHPDVGGDVQAMQRVNVASDYLLETLPELLGGRR